MLINSQALLRSLLAVCVVLLGANVNDTHGQHLPDYPYISAGGGQSLALKEDGSVVAWGDNILGECEVPGNLKAVAIDAGTFHSLGLQDNGSVFAWGHNGYGQCDLPPNLKAIAISAGHVHSLALQEDGSVVAWGDNDHGQCDVPPNLKAVAIDAGRDHSLALQEDGSVIAWGSNAHGQCYIPSNLKAVDISAAGHSLALQEDGSVVAWGNNDHGQCEVPPNLKAVAIDAGYDHSLALQEDGSVVAWGYVRNGQCDVPPNLKAIAIDAGSFFSLALKEDGGVVAWGSNGSSQCDVPSNLVAQISEFSSMKLKGLGANPWGQHAITDKSENKTDVVASGQQQRSARTTGEVRVRITDHQEVEKVAVIGKESTMCDGSRDDGVALGELVSGELVGLYGVVERKHLDDILNEQRLAMGGLIFEDSDYAKAGCLAGAQGTVLASYGCLQGKTKIQVKLVDCSTADIYWSATGVDVSEFELLDELRVKLESR